MKLPERLTLKRLGPLCATLAALWLILYFAAIISNLNRVERVESSQYLDFVAYWAAAKLALAGMPLDVFDTNAYFLAQDLPSHYDEPIYWFYPPHFLLLVMPLGALPFSAALIVFALISLIAFGLAIRRIAGDTHGMTALALASPAVVIGTMIGNASILWAALFAAAIPALAYRDARRAGLLLAAMTIKPHLGFMIPLALIADRAWKTILWAGLGTMVLLVLGTLAFGIEYWRLFLDHIGFASTLMAEGGLPVQRMTSWYAWFRVLGVTHDQALNIQLGVTILMAIIVVVVWMRRTTPFDLRAAVLAIAIPLATPYSYHYDMALGVIALALLLRSGYLRDLPGRMIAVLIWIGPLPGVFPQLPVSVAVLGAPILTAGLIYCLVLIALPEAKVPAHDISS